jgi:hypothetical protein
MMIELDNGTCMKHCIFLISSRWLGRSLGLFKLMRIFDPCATRVKNPFRQIEFKLFFVVFFMIYCMSDWDFTSLSPSQTHGF